MDTNEAVIEEIEALKAIFIEELEVEYHEGRPNSLTTKLYPSTADDPNQQYVCLVLTLKLPLDYPEQTPEILISSPRGLSDEFCHSILSKCREKCTEYQGFPVLYEIIQLVKDQLTLCNRPVGTCPICLYGFVEGDAITVTGCYHHYHCHCLGRYITACLRQFEELEKDYAEQVGKTKPENKTICAVCREPLKIDPVHLNLAPPPKESENDGLYCSSQESQHQLQWRQKMTELYEKQRHQGGIIDTEAENTRVLLITEEAPSQENGGETVNGSASLPSVSNLPVESVPVATPTSGGNTKPRNPKNHYQRNDGPHQRRDSRQAPRQRGGFSQPRPHFPQDSHPRPRSNQGFQRENHREDRVDCGVQYRGEYRGSRRDGGFPRTVRTNSPLVKGGVITEGIAVGVAKHCQVEGAVQMVPVESLAALSLRAEEPGTSNGRDVREFPRKQARPPPGFPKR